MTSVPLISFHWRHPHLRPFKPICACNVTSQQMAIHTRSVFRSQPSLPHRRSTTSFFSSSSSSDLGAHLRKLSYQIEPRNFTVSQNGFGVWKQINELINGRCYSVRSALCQRNIWRITGILYMNSQFRQEVKDCPESHILQCRSIKKIFCSVTKLRNCVCYC